ncbi:hypothetical protein JAAARDRAFT_70452 [Jaapia argillacea MUCL 33604]|uniref:G-protein coupled receptors family 1 profile domain-containing protein n=1 Tax=Jaapia argillacea MUCL 33604 TaxID=933084 RepID=A0A067PZR4_9AGAM|nr:hypothetical protein JAAARDRAFT_70452 [Jaapia argillacea MUCL 33604]
MFGGDWRKGFYFCALMAGGGLDTLLLATLLLRSNAKRNPILISLIFSWWISIFPCLPLLYYSGHASGPPPPFATCLASASLVMAQAAMAASTAAAIVFHIWFLVRTALRPLTNQGASLSVITALNELQLLIVPYVLFTVTALVILKLGLSDHAKVSRANFYCVVDSAVPSALVGTVCVITLLSAVIFGAWTLSILHQSQSRLTQLGIDTSLIVRVVIFGVYIFIALCFSAASITDWTDPTYDLFLSTCGIAVFIIFGTQKDLYRTWLRGLKALAPRPLSPVPSLTNPQSLTIMSPSIYPHINTGDEGHIVDYKQDSSPSHGKSPESQSHQGSGSSDGDHGIPARVWSPTSHRTYPTSHSDTP